MTMDKERFDEGMQIFGKLRLEHSAKRPGWEEVRDHFMLGYGWRPQEIREFLDVRLRQLMAKIQGTPTKKGKEFSQAGGELLRVETKAGPEEAVGLREVALFALKRGGVKIDDEEFFLTGDAYAVYRRYILHGEGKES